MAPKKTIPSGTTVAKKKTTTKINTQEKEPEPMAASKNETAQQSSAQSSADMRVNLGDIINGFATTSSRMVQKAASILEEEIAAGIVAAKEVENKFINVKSIRSRPSDEVIHRFRRDSHEIVDILLDLLDVSVKNAGGIAQKIINVRGSSSSKKKAESSSSEMPVLNMPSALAPGASGTISMLFENSQNKATGVFKVACTDLLSSTGGTIPASSISFSPSTIDIAPRAQQEIGVTVTVPGKAKPGVYSGLIQATNIEQLRAVLIVAVK